MYYRSSRQKKQKGLEMNKKILLSLLIIGIIVSVASAGTWAYFSDVKSTQQNSLTAGTLKLNDGITQTKLFEYDGLIIPGKSNSQSINVQNTGNVPGDLYVRINPNAYQTNDLFNYITLTYNYQSLTSDYQYVGWLGAGSSTDVNFAYLMPTTVTEGQGTTAGFKVDFLLVQDDVTDPTSQLTYSQLNP